MDRPPALPVLPPPDLGTPKTAAQSQRTVLTPKTRVPLTATPPLPPAGRSQRLPISKPETEGKEGKDEDPPKEASPPPLPSHPPRAEDEDTKSPEPPTPRRIVPRPPGNNMNLGARADFATLKGQIANQLSRNLAENGGLSKISDKQLNMRASEVRVATKLTPDQRARMEVTRRRLITEMLETEVTYVQGLQVLTKVYRVPLLQTDILPKVQVDKLFSNIESLLELNERFCAELRAVAESRTQCVGPLFISYAPLFRIYKTFVNNHESAASQLGKLLSDRGGMQRFKDFHKECEQKPEAQGLSLASFLIMPIQRIPRYKLLLVEVIKNTPPEHPDEKLVQGHDELRDIAMEINNSIKEIENRTKLLALQTTCDTPLFAPNRWFIREGDLTKKCRAGDKKFTYFLFSDMLMYGTKLPLNKYKISHKIPIDQAFQLKESDVQFGWQLINSVKSFIVYAMDEAEKTQWVNDITECVTKFQESLKGKNAVGEGSAAKPIWESNANSETCPLCQKKFTTFFRRHHCRKCGQLCCSECSRFGVEKKGERYCVKCFTEAGYQEDTDTERASTASHRRNGSGSAMDLDTPRKSVTADMILAAAPKPPKVPKNMGEDIVEEEEGEEERKSESKKDDKTPKSRAKIQRFGAVKAPQGPFFPGCFKEGFLSKKGQKLNTWKRRYFVLQNGKLMYFETLDTKKLGGQVEVGKASTFGVRGTSNAFWICPVPNAPNASTLELEAEDAATRDSWLEAFRQFTAGPQSPGGISSPLSPSQSSANITDDLISKMSVILTQKPPAVRHVAKPSTELALPAALEAEDSGWKQLIDEDSGSPFYWHEVTGVSSWDVPPDYKPGN